MRSNERFSKYFNLASNPYYFDFFDIKVNRDTKAFLDPGILRATENDFADECKNLVQTFFDCFLVSVVSNDEEKGLRLLAGLHETNYYHLGLSKEKSNGNSTGRELNCKIWESFRNSRAAKTGLLQDIEDSALFIEKIGPDRISDMVCAILREKFAKYTYEICKYYQLEAHLGEVALECWDGGEWVKKKFSLPKTEYTPIILIPKFLIRQKTITNSRYFQNNYIFDELRRVEINENSELVKIIKARNEPAVYQKDLRKKYGVGKKSIVEQTINYRDALNRYRSDIRNSPPKTLSLDELSRIMGVGFFNPDLVSEELKKVAISSESDEAYSLVIDLIFNCLFHGGIVFSNEIGNKNCIKYYANNSNKFLKYIKETKNITEINLFKINSVLDESLYESLIGDSSNDKNAFNFFFCRNRGLISTHKNSIFIEDADFREIFYEYKEGVLFEDDGFFRRI